MLTTIELLKIEAEVLCDDGGLTLNILLAAERKYGFTALTEAIELYRKLDHKPQSIATKEAEIRYIIGIAKTVTWDGLDYTDFTNAKRTDYGYNRMIMIGEAEYEWDGCVQTSATEYDKLSVPFHPHATKEGFVYAHRVLAEEKIGRHLKKNELVHHIDHNPMNNNPDNLEVMTLGKHKKRHAREENIKLYERCSVCNKRFRVPLTKHIRKTLIDGNGTWYCGRSCMTSAKHEAGVFNRPAKEMVTLTCAKCGCEFEREAKRVRYKLKHGQEQFWCNQSCSSKTKMDRRYGKPEDQ